MNYRELGNTGLMISEVSFGTWAIGGAWGKTDDTEALKSLQHAIDQGVNFLILQMFMVMVIAKNYWLKPQKDLKTRFILEQSFAEKVISFHRKITHMKRLSLIARIA